MKFSCTQCGLCCKNITGIKLLNEFDNGNGVCIHFGEVENKCKIYEKRPLVCRVDEAHKVMFPHVPLDEYIQENIKVCRALQASAGVLYKIK